MISFQPAEEELSFIEVAKDLAINKIRPLVKDAVIDDNGAQDVISQMRELGFLDLELPESWNGLELPLITQVQILKELSYGDLDFIQSLSGLSDAISLIRLFPENEQVTAFKKKILSNDEAVITLIEVGNQESSIGNSLQLMEDGDGYTLQGRSLPTRLAKNCNIILFSLNTSKHKLIFYLDEPNEWIVETDNRLGLIHSGVASLQFHNTKIPNNQVLAAGTLAEEIITKAKTRNQILQAAKEVGLAEAALDYATEYTAERKAFGQEIAKFQGVSFRIAKMAIEARAANHLVLEAALQADQDTTQAESYALRALHRAHRAVRFNTDSAVQLLGGHGFIREYPVEKWMRDAQAQVILYGRERELLLEFGKRLAEAEKDVAYR